MGKICVTTEKGFTLPELLIAMSIVLSLLFIATLNFVSVKQRTSLNSSVSILVNDMKSQQLKAMIGDTEGGGTRSDYGIRILPSSSEYILFNGSEYDEDNINNFPVELGDNVEFNAGEDLIFTKVNGEISGGSKSITLYERTTHEQRTIIVNKYGIVTSVTN